MQRKKMLQKIEIKTFFFFLYDGLFMNYLCVILIHMTFCQFPDESAKNRSSHLSRYSL